MTLDAGIAASLTAFLLCASIAITSAEQIRSYDRLSHFIAPELDRSRARNSEQLVLGLLIGRALLALFCAVQTALVGLPAIGLAMLCIVMLTITWIRPVGGDGADQLQLICITVLAASLLMAGPEKGAHWASLYIAFQMNLSYATTGWAKLASPVWRNGDALGRILSTFSYGHPGAAKALTTNPALNRAGTWGPVILFSIAPLMFLQPSFELFATFLVLALGFHIGTGLFMGLNNFLITFPATYPCLVYAYLFLHSHWLGT